MSAAEVDDRDAEFRVVIDSLGVTIHEDRDLPEGWWGCYHHKTKTIRLRPGLAPIQRRSTLAHELGHAVFSHDGPDDEQERQAREWAADFLIESAESLAAAAIAGNLRGVLSLELKVMPWDVTEYVRSNGPATWAALRMSGALTEGNGWKDIKPERRALHAPGMPYLPRTPTQALRDSIEETRLGLSTADQMHALLNQLETLLGLRSTVASGT